MSDVSKMKLEELASVLTGDTLHTMALLEEAARRHHPVLKLRRYRYRSRGRRVGRQ